MQLKQKCLFLILLGLFIISPSYADEEAKAPIPIIVNGDNVEYFQNEQKVVGSGNVEVNHGGVRLSCDKMTVYLDTKIANAEGNVRLFQDGYEYYGETATYNFETKKGNVITAGVNADPWYGKGKMVEKAGDAEYSIVEGYFTSCDLEKPHYRVGAKKVTIYLDEKIVARNCMMYVGNIPVLYIPFYVHPLNDKRPSVTVVPGYDKEWGGFALTKWRYDLNEYMKGYMHLDYREKKDLASGTDLKYDTKVLGDGILQTYYMNERTIYAKRIWDKHDPPTTEKERYKVQLRHKWNVDPDTSVRTEFHKFSDSTMLKDYFYRDYEEDESPPTYVSALRQRPFYSAEFRVDKRANRYETIVERLPEFDLDIGKNKLLKTNFYYTSDNSVSNLDKKFGNDASEDLDAARFDTYNEISYLADIYDILSVYPYVATRQTYFSKDAYGDPDQIRGVLYAGVDTSARFYRTFDFETNLFGLDINGLRHVINPVVKYYYNHHPTMLPEKLMQFDSLDGIDRQNGLRLEFENRLQTKRDEDGGVKTIDFARLLLATDYLYKVEQGSEFTGFDGELELRPYKWLYVDADARYDHDRAKIERASWDVIARDTGPEKKWSFGVGQRYEEDRSSQLTTELSYKINPAWQVRAYERFQFDENALKEQEYAIVRDLHCWTVELLYNKFRPDVDTFWIVFRLKALPGIPIKASTSYRKPKTESQRF